MTTGYTIPDLRPLYVYKAYKDAPERLAPNDSLDLLIEPLGIATSMQLYVGAIFPTSVTVFEGVDISGMGDALLAAPDSKHPLSPVAVSIGPTSTEPGTPVATGTADHQFPFLFGYTTLDPSKPYLVRVTNTHDEPSPISPMLFLRTGPRFESKG